MNTPDDIKKMQRAIIALIDVVCMLQKEVDATEKEMRKLAILMNLRDIHIKNLTKKLKSKKDAKNKYK